MPTVEYTITTLIKAEDKLSKTLTYIQKRLKIFGNQMEKEALRTRAFFNILKNAASLVSGFISFEVFGNLTKAVYESVNSFIRFEGASVRLASLAREAGQSIDGLALAFRVVASAASRELAVGVNEAMDSLEALVKAGLSGRDAVDALRSAIMMARIEGVGFAEAANSLVQVMAQFGLRGKEAARAVDVLVNASRLGIGSAYDFAQGLARAGATARALGLSLEDATTWLVILERRFGSAEEAGTHLNRFLLDLLEIAGKLGVPIRDASGSMRDINDVILDVVRSAKELGGDFASLQERLRGVDMRAQKALFTFTQMSESFSELRDAIARSGTTYETYLELLETTEGRLARLRAENERLMRSMGEGLATAWTTIAPVLMKMGQEFVSNIEAMAYAVTGFQNNVLLLRALLEREFLLTGRISEELAGEIIKMWVDMRRISVDEGLKIAESLGIYTSHIQELIDRAIAMGVEVPEELRKVSEAFNQLGEDINLARQGMESLAGSVKTMVSELGLLRDSASLMSDFYNVTLAIERALGRNVELTEEARMSQQRLVATQQLLSFVMNGFNLVQQAMQMYMLGGKEAGDLLINTFTTLAQSLQDGVMTEQEFINLLQQLGVNADNVAGSLNNVMVKALEATRNAVEKNVDAVQNLINLLTQLDGMTATYTIVERRIVRSAGTPEQTEYMARERRRPGMEYIVPEAQRGAWFTREGLYYLHRGEMVLPRDVAEWFRRGGVSSNKIVNVSVNVNVNSVGSEMDWDRVAEIVSRKINRRLVGM